MSAREVQPIPRPTATTVPGPCPHCVPPATAHRTQGIELMHALTVAALAALHALSHRCGLTAEEMDAIESEAACLCPDLWRQTVQLLQVAQGGRRRCPHRHRVPAAHPPVARSRRRGGMCCQIWGPHRGCACERCLPPRDCCSPPRSRPEGHRRRQCVLLPHPDSPRPRGAARGDGAGDRGRCAPRDPRAPAGRGRGVEFPSRGPSVRRTRGNDRWRLRARNAGPRAAPGRRPRCRGEHDHADLLNPGPLDPLVPDPP